MWGLALSNAEESGVFGLKIDHIETFGGPRQGNNCLGSQLVELPELWALLPLCEFGWGLALSVSLSLASLVLCLSSDRSSTLPPWSVPFSCNSVPLSICSQPLHLLCGLSLPSAFFPFHCSNLLLLSFSWSSFLHHPFSELSLSPSAVLEGPSHAICHMLFGTKWQPLAHVDLETRQPYYHTTNTEWQMKRSKAWSSNHKILFI